MGVREKKIRDIWFIFFQDKNKTVQVKFTRRIQGELNCKTKKATFNAEKSGCVQHLSKDGVHTKNLQNYLESSWGEKNHRE